MPEAISHMNMATLRSLSHFTCVQQAPSSTSSPTTPPSTIPKLHIHTDAAFAARKTPCTRRTSRPEPLRMTSSPPDSPPRNRANTLGVSSTMSELSSLHVSGTVTPPPTPTGASHHKTGSRSSTHSFGLERVDSITLTGKMRGGGGSPTEEGVDENEKETGPPGLKEFPHWATDYDFEMVDKDGKKKKKPLGSGLWSDVYSALPTLPKPPSPSAADTPSATGALMESGILEGADASFTPPLTPVKSRTSSLSKVIPSSTAYAIKVPASRSAKKVLHAEAEILSHLSRFPSSETYVVPFYGLDMRTGALVLKAMDRTLETWISSSLNSLPEQARAASLAELFPSLALTLIRGLEWIHSKGCIHADIKPSNILFPATSTNAVYSDFSSANLVHPTPSQDSKPPTTLGGGTWDFLSPALVAKSSKESPVTPTLETDVWSLAITLLYVIIGQSPFDCAGSNVYRRREMVKQGVPLSYTAYGDDGPRNLKRLDTLSKDLGLDLKKWFAGVLDTSAKVQVDVRRWREELEGAMGKGGEVKI